MEKDDQTLLAAIRAGDDDAMATLLARHAPAIYRFGVKMCRDPEDAKDVLQDTLLAVARGVREFRGGASLSTWLYTVARSFCIKKRRTSKFAPAETISLDDDSKAVLAPSAERDPEARAIEHELGARLDHAIASLEPDHREVLVLRDVEGLTALEVAEVLGISVDAVKSRLHRARSQVRKEVEEGLAPSVREGARRRAPGCPDVVGLFSRYLEGDIGAAECDAMQAHVASCTSCTAACESLKQTLALCRTESGESVPFDVQELVRRALREAVGR